MLFITQEFVVVLLLIITAAIIILVRYLTHVKRIRTDQRLLSDGKPAEAINAGYGILYERGKRAALSEFKERYDRLFNSFDIPEAAREVAKCVCVFSLEHVCVDHYAWNDGEALNFFPKWQSIAYYLHDPEYLHRYDEREADVLFGWRIPCAGFEYYDASKGDGIVTAAYADKSGKKYRAVFLEGAESFFKSFYPDRDYAVIQRKSYLGSRMNIRDIKSEMLAIEEKMNNGEINGQQYEYEKWRLLHRM